MTIWTLNQSSVIPGVPNDTYPHSGVAVDVDDATNTVRSVTPLVTHSEFVPAPVEPEQATEQEDKDAAPEPVKIVDEPAPVEPQL